MSDATRPPMLARRILAVAAALLALGGFATPLLLATEGDDRPIWMLEAVPGLALASGDSLSGVGVIAAIAVGGFAVVLAGVAVLAIVRAARPHTARVARVLAVACVVLLVGCVGLALLVLVVSVNADGRALPLSPAAVLAAGAGVLGLLAARTRGPATS